MSFIKRKLGFSLIEMIVYITVLSIISLVVMNTIVSFTKSYKILGALRAVEHSAIDSMERMTRDIRSASSIDITNSTFGSNPGVLTIISTSGSFSTTTKFYLQNNVLKMDVNGVYYGPLTLSNATITNLIFTNLNSGISKAVKIDMTIDGSVGGVTKTGTYHSTIILKGL